MKRIILLLSTLCFFVSPYVQAQNEGSDALLIINKCLS